MIGSDPIDIHILEILQQEAPAYHIVNASRLQVAGPAEVRSEQPHVLPVFDHRVELLAVCAVDPPAHSSVARPVEAGGGAHGTPPTLRQLRLPIEPGDLAVPLPHPVPGVDGVVLVSHLQYQWGNWTLSY